MCYLETTVTKVLEQRRGNTLSEYVDNPNILRTLVLDEVEGDVDDANIVAGQACSSIRGL